MARVEDAAPVAPGNDFQAAAPGVGVVERCPDRHQGVSIQRPPTILVPRQPGPRARRFDHGHGAEAGDGDVAVDVLADGAERGSLEVAPEGPHELQILDLPVVQRGTLEALGLASEVAVAAAR